MTTASYGRRATTLAQRLARPLETARMLTDPPDELTELANRFRTDKGSLPGGHHYTRIYSELFAPLRDRPVRLLELGLLGLGQGGWDDEALRDSGAARGRDAPSLRMWAGYFRSGQIFGVDFNDFSAVEIDRCRIFRADAGSPVELAKVAAAIGGELDIVIDDASHASHHQQTALGTLFPCLRPGGLYFIEDLFHQPADREPPGGIKTADMLKRAEVGGEFESPHLSEEACAHLAGEVAGVALFDSLSPGGALTTRDALGVIWKKPR